MCSLAAVKVKLKSMQTGQCVVSVDGADGLRALVACLETDGIELSQDKRRMTDGRTEDESGVVAV